MDGMARDDLARLPGFGATTAQWLLDIGIESYDDIEELGSLDVYLRLRASRPGVSLNALWALESLLMGCDWRDLPPERKAELRRQLQADEPGRQG
jgi:DNA transformation protein and related proteins